MVLFYANISFSEIYLGNRLKKSKIAYHQSIFIS